MMPVTKIKVETCECCGRDLPESEICEYCGFNNHRLHKLSGWSYKRIRKEIKAEQLERRRFKEDVEPILKGE